MSLEIMVVALAGIAALIAGISSQRAISSHRARAGANVFGSGHSEGRGDLKAEVEKVFQRVESEIDAASREIEGRLMHNDAPIFLPFRGLAGARAPLTPEATRTNLGIAISLLRDYLDSASDEEVQRLLPMLQYLQQKALERAAELHPPVMPSPPA